MTRNVKGCLMMALPPIVLAGVLMVWAVTSFVASSLLQSDAAASGGTLAALRVANTGLGFIGILSVLAVPLFFIIGLIYILTAPKPMAPPEPPQDQTPPSDTNTQTPA